MTNIYISSTYKDLKQHREKVCLALRTAGYKDVTLMEEYAADDRRPVDKCLEDVRRADIYVGVFGWRYGYIPDQPEDKNPKRLSITELELRRALGQKHTACLVFLSNPEVAQIPDCDKDAFSGENDPERIRALRSDLGKSKTAGFFDNPDHLASLVQSAVSKHLREAEARTPGTREERPPITWNVAEKGPPYPGLMHFTPKYAPVFFGREAEVREIIDRLYEPAGHFMIVSGGSGSGKSSLVHAGVLWRLEQNGLGDASLEWDYMLPSNGANCFEALARALEPQLQRAGESGAETAHALTAATPESFAATLGKLVATGRQKDALVLFIDQMEELFAAGHTAEDLATRLLTGLHEASAVGHLRVIATIRNDQLGPLYDHPRMLGVLNSTAHYSLGPVPAYALDDVIVRPAQSAGVEVPPGLVSKLVEDIGLDAGSLPLLAFALQRLFLQAENGAMREDLYDRWGGKNLGRLEGAIAEHAEAAERRLATADEEQLDTTEADARLSGLRARLAKVFPKLVRVDIEGAPLRLRAPLSDLTDEETEIAHMFSGKEVRLLVTDAEQGQPRASGETERIETVTIAHEKLLSAWPTLAAWVDSNRGDLITLRRAEVDARDWVKSAHDPEHLWWPPRRLSELQSVMQKLRDHPISDVVRRFAAPQRALLERLKRMDMVHKHRERIGEYLTELGDPRCGVGLNADGLPDIDWVDIEGGKVQLEDDAGAQQVPDFRISRYLVNNKQFQAFVDDEGGYPNTAWWQDMPDDANDGPRPSTWSEPSAPRETVSWYEAVAFCHWLSDRLGSKVRLPDEFEWQQAATRGDPANRYPWGEDWDARLCNSIESKLNRTTLVGLYPAGTWRTDGQTGPLDMAGNMDEWCSNKYGTPDEVGVDASGVTRVVRGGCWFSYPDDLRSAYRYYFDPDYRGYLIGFRVVCRPPSSTEH